jgi:hypothetical protein
VLMIVFIRCFAIGVSVDVWINSETSAVRAKHLTARFEALGASIPGLTLRSGIVCLVGAAVSYYGIISPYSVSLLYSITNYYVVLGVATLAGISAIHFFIIWLLLRFGASDARENIATVHPHGDADASAALKRARRA